MKYLAKSAEVLNEADRFQRVLDWELFTSNQDVQLNHLYMEGVSWRPGDFLYDYPGLDICDHEDCGYCAPRRVGLGALPNPDYEGNCVRPMIQEYDMVGGLSEGVRFQPDIEYDWIIDSDYANIDPICCEVWWDRYKEADCWICGKEFPLLERVRHKSMGELMRGIYGWNSQRVPEGEAVGHITNIEHDENGMVVSFRLSDHQQRMMESVRNMGEEYRRASFQVSRSFNRFGEAMRLMQNYVAFDIEMINDTIYEWGAGPYRNAPAPFVPFRGRSFHNPWVEEPNPLKRPNVRGPMWGTAVLFDPREESHPLEVNSMYGKLPRNWRQMRADVPTFQLLEPRDFSTWTNGWTNGPPTTLDRRQRNVGTRPS